MQEHEARGRIIAALAANAPGTIPPDVWFPDMVRVGPDLVEPDGRAAILDQAPGPFKDGNEGLFIRFTPASATLVRLALEGWWSAHGRDR